MFIETGHCTFDRQTNLIAPGDVVANTQISRCIRPWSETTNATGVGSAPGYLQNSDLEIFGGLPQEVLAGVQDADERVLLYKFFHKRGTQIIVHGYVLTNTDGELLDYWVVGPTYKSRNVIQKCMSSIVAKDQGSWWQRLVKRFRSR